MNQEIMRVLELIEEGKVNADQGMELIKAMSSEEKKDESQSVNETGRFFKVKVDGDKTKVNVNIPIRLVKVATKFVNLGMNFIPQEARHEMDKRGIDLNQIDFNELVDLIDQGLADGKLVDVDLQDPTEGHMTVAVYVE